MNNRAERRRYKHKEMVPGFTPIWSKKVVKTGKTIWGEKQLRHDPPTKTRKEANRSVKHRAVNPELLAQSLINGVV